MQLIPALDIRNGRCVRLLKGDFERETRYDVDPVELATRYRVLGAQWLHIVDLDGAASGHPVNADLVERISSGGLNIQLGGGIRDQTSLEAAAAVADRLVIGSLAVTHPDQVIAWMNDYGPDRFTLGFDVRFGADSVPYLTTHGWTRTTQVPLEAAIDQYVDAGLRHVLCTDVDRDGALAGPNLDLYRDCVRRWPELAFQASGGIRDSRDLTQLAEIDVAAAISGKALLEDRLTDREISQFLPNA